MVCLEFEDGSMAVIIETSFCFWLTIFLVELTSPKLTGSSDSLLNKSRQITDRSLTKLLPENNFKEPTRPKAEKLGTQQVKCLVLLQKI